MKASLIRKTTGILGLLLWATSLAISQTISSESTKTALIPAPGNIQLPAGYVYERRRGIDSQVGLMVRTDGFTIKHDIGRMAGNYSDQYFPEHFEKLRKQTHLNSATIERRIQGLQDKVEWRKRQTFNGRDVMVVLLKDASLIATFVDSNANFIAHADSDEKITDFLLIVLTYQPPDPPVSKP